MNEQIFWELIDQAKNEANGDLDEQLEIVVSNLSQFPSEEIIEFGRIFDKYKVKSYTSDLWAAAYIINGGCSDDGFEYFRAWLISRGRKVYEDVIKNPESLADIVSDEECVEGQFEEFLSVAHDAYKMRTGKDDFYDKVECITLPEIELTWDEDSEELETMFPKLSEKFW